MDTTSINVQEVAFTLLANICKTKPAWLPGKSDAEMLKEPLTPDFFDKIARFETKEEVLQRSMDLLTRAFDSLDSYIVHKKKKRSGGYRIISEPLQDLKEVQRKILRRLYRLKKRTDHYEENLSDWKKLFYKGIKKHFIDHRVHGCLQKKSVSTTVKGHTNTNAYFVTEFDFKDAFPSVKKDTVSSVLYSVLLTEFQSYFYTYKERPTKYRGRSDEYIQRKRGRTRGHGFNDAYGRFPLFTNRECPEFRKLVREQGKAYADFADTALPEIARVLADLISELAMFKDELPQGAPMSGFLIALVVSEKKILSNFPGRASIYVDNIIVSTMKKPDQRMIEQTESLIQNTGIFILNKEKTKVYDLRNQSAPLLGMKLVKRFASEKEKGEMKNDIRWGYAPRGFCKRNKQGRRWEIKHLSLSQEKQKQYRAMIHKCIVGDPEPDFLNRVNGYIGHLVSIYGWPATHMPSCVSKLVHAYREKYRIYKH